MTGKQILLGAAAIIFLLLLLSWGKVTGTLERTWADTEVPCLINGHTTVSQHIHAELHIFVDGIEEMLPVNAGITEECMAEVHTHEEPYVIHIETAEPDTRYPLKTFFEVSGRQYEREGYSVALLVDGAPNSAGESLMLKDGQVIELRYESPEYINSRTEAVPLEELFPEEEKKKPAGPMRLQFQ